MVVLPAQLSSRSLYGTGLSELYVAGVASPSEERKAVAVAARRAGIGESVASAQ